MLGYMTKAEKVFMAHVAELTRLGLIDNTNVGWSQDPDNCSFMSKIYAVPRQYLWTGLNEDGKIIHEMTI